MPSHPPARSGARQKMKAAKTRLAVIRAAATEPLAPAPAEVDERPTPSRFSLRPDGLLVPEPVFVFSSVRSGSTLVRMLLNSHSQICAPHEMHLGSLEVRASTGNARKALRALDLDERTLENLLWDRVLQIQAIESGKPIVVDKTPNTTLQWRRVAAFWPRLRPLVLLRHPQRIAESLIASRPDIDLEKHHRRVTSYAVALRELRDELDPLTVRYETLTAQPAQVTREICAWLGVEWEESMLDYAAHRHGGKYKRGLGDWSETIRSGTIQAAPPDPDLDDVPEALHEACRLLGYA